MIHFYLGSNKVFKYCFSRIKLFDWIGMRHTLTPITDLDVKCKGEFKFLQSFQMTSSSYNFSCCRPNVNVFANVDSVIKKRGNAMSQTIKLSTTKYSYIPKSRYTELSFSCAWDTKKDIEILQGFVLQRFSEYTKVYRYLVFHKGWKTTTTAWHQMTCNRLDKKWHGGCVKMRSPWIPIDNLLVKDLPVIGCRDATMVNGRNVDDGRRRFLRSVSMEKSANKFRYYFDCCRFGT